MIRIGILTYFNYINYGSMLQGYATLKAFTKFLSPDDDCLLINYRYQAPFDKSRGAMLRLRLRRGLHYLTSLKEIYTKYRYSSKLNQKAKYFDAFRENFTCITPEFYRDKAQLEQNPPLFDVYVTGSDQTWSPKVSGGYTLTPMFLDFAPENSLKAAYAPSLGTTSLSDEDKSVLEGKLRKFSVLSCRENSGTELLRTVTGRDVKKVLDPTLLISADEWRTIAINPSMERGKYILCYFIGHRDYYRKYAEQLGKQLNLPVYYIPVSWKDCSKSKKLLFDVGPREFVGLIDNAAVVLTDSFHGTAFSTNLNTPFYSFVKHSGGSESADNSRLFDYLSSVGLENRLEDDYKGGEINYAEIDFDTVNESLAEQRSASEDVMREIVNLARTWND
ncbi:MAG: polysaccharide pyruvyl transferase family protein [Bacteroidales bacterium]|nr:polysaccharide pyruvyl transferase family protein [Bacteroidales bacterium]